jgi:hypothetical protein
MANLTHQITVLLTTVSGIVISVVKVVTAVSPCQLPFAPSALGGFTEFIENAPASSIHPLNLLRAHFERSSATCFSFTRKHLQHHIRPPSQFLRHSTAEVTGKARRLGKLHILPQSILFCSCKITYRLLSVDRALSNLYTPRIMAKGNKSDLTPVGIFLCALGIVLFLGAAFIELSQKHFATFFLLAFGAAACGIVGTFLWLSWKQNR